MKTIALNTNNMGKILTFEMKTLFEAIYAVKNTVKMYKLENLNNIEIVGELNDAQITFVDNNGSTNNIKYIKN